MTQDKWAGIGLADRFVATLIRGGLTGPTPIQAQAISPQINGKDILGLAQTGSGKTAAFVLPLLQGLAAMKGRPRPRTARALIMVPTRELAAQIDDTARKLAGGLRISTVLVLGGMSRMAQIRALERGVDIVIATPGRLADLMHARHVRFDETGILILDEADRMLDMGFAKQVQAIAATLNPRRRTALFSATMPGEVSALANGLLRDPVRVEVARSGETVPEIEQSVELLAHGAKRARLAEILSGPEMSRAIVFTRTKRGADRVTENLEKDGVPANAIHGNKSQNARQRALDAFRSGRTRVLVASDIASRGIDVPGISHVVQYDLPDEPEAYVHRIGRTGRAGETGVAIALCSPEEGDKLRAIERLTKLSLAPDAETRPAQRRQRNPRRRAGATQAHEPSTSNAKSRRRRRRPKRGTAA
ncbi:MAG: DEAD/DEAH box helicase [Pseudomonadota bacterium]